VLVLCIYNNDYHSGVIWSVMRDNDFFSWRREMLQQFQSVSAGEVYNLLQQETKGWNMITSHSAYGIPCLYSPQGDAAIDLSSGLDGALSSRELFRDRPGAAGEFLRGHLPWNDKLFHDTPELWDGARDHGLRKG
jgi:LuxR family transcriptional regulator